MTQKKANPIFSLEDLDELDLLLDDPSPGEEFTPEDLNYITETVCIIADKVYAHCQQRHCFPKVELNIGDKGLKKILFEEGKIVPGSLCISNMPNHRKNFKRVKFTLRIPYKVITCSGEVINGNLPDIVKDVVMFMPDARSEFDFKIVVETASQVLGKPDVCKGTLTFAVGTFIIIKVVGKVQLLIPAFGFCPEPPECEEYTDKNICVDFENEEFPEFFPPQFEDIYGSK